MTGIIDNARQPSWYSPTAFLTIEGGCGGTPRRQSGHIKSAVEAAHVVAPSLCWGRGLKACIAPPAETLTHDMSGLHLGRGCSF